MDVHLLHTHISDVKKSREWIIPLLLWRSINSRRLIIFTSTRVAAAAAGHDGPQTLRFPVRLLSLFLRWKRYLYTRGPLMPGKRVSRRLEYARTLEGGLISAPARSIWCSASCTRGTITRKRGWGLSRGCGAGRNGWCVRKGEPEGRTTTLQWENCDNVAFSVIRWCITEEFKIL